MINPIGAVAPPKDPTHSFLEPHVVNKVGDHLELKRLAKAWIHSIWQVHALDLSPWRSPPGMIQMPRGRRAYQHARVRHRGRYGASRLFAFSVLAIESVQKFIPVIRAAPTGWLLANPRMASAESGTAGAGLVRLACSVTAVRPGH